MCNSISLLLSTLVHVGVCQQVCLTDRPQVRTGQVARSGPPRPPALC